MMMNNFTQCRAHCSKKVFHDAILIVLMVDQLVLCSPRPFLIIGFPVAVSGGQVLLLSSLIAGPANRPPRYEFPATSSGGLSPSLAYSGG